MKIINLTPHDIVFVREGAADIVVPASGKIARVAVKTVIIGDINGIPVTTSVFGGVEDLPEPTADTIYIVSSIVASRVTNREDVYIPNESVRDDKGRIIGCKSLGKI